MYMQDPLAPETELVAALKLTAGPPQAWIEAAAMIPSTLGDLDAIERILDDPAFRETFAHDPHRAVEEAGLTPTGPLLAAVRDRLAD
jgi:hypothetical protein